MPDATRAWAVLDYIRTHPEHHDQADFFALSLYDPRRELSDRMQDVFTDAAGTLNSCGTTACFAGWVALLGGHRLNMYGFNEHRRHAQSIATELLGIDDEQADLLFFQAQSLDALETAIAEVFGPRPAPRVLVGAGAGDGHAE